MPGSSFDSKSVDFVSNFGITRESLNYFFPYFILFDQSLKTIDCGRLLTKLGLFSTAASDFEIKKTGLPLSFQYIDKNIKGRVVLVHSGSRIIFFGEFHLAKDGLSYLGFFTPKITSTDVVAKLNVSGSDFAPVDSTLDSALLFQTQQNLMQENLKLIEKLVNEQEKLENFNLDLERVIEERTQELNLTKAQSINVAKLAALGEMASGIAHEIHNPLAIIASSALVLKRLHKKDKLPPKEFNEIILNIEDTVKRVAKIVNAMRTLSQNANNSEMKSVSLKEVMGNVMALCSAKFKDKGIDLDFDLDSKAYQVNVMGDCVQLGQVLINLMSNAASAIEVQKEKWIRFEVSQDDRFHILKMTDSGPGIPKDIQDKIFQPFFTTKSVEKGTGLGLSISQKIMEKFGGSLFLDQASPKTCFTMMLVKG